MTDLNSEVRELNIDELEAVGGGLISQLVAWAYTVGYGGEGPSPNGYVPPGQLRSGGLPIRF